MAKAINWPKSFRNEVLEEDEIQQRCALRVGRLYYDNQYWVEGELVDIRVNHKIIRRARIQGELKCCPIQELSVEDYAQQKQGLQSMANVIQFLTETYQQPVSEATEVTVVYYRNLPVEPELVEVEDDPHMV